MNQFQKTFDDIVELTRAKPIGTAGSFSGLCPSHDDKSPSLSITLENDRILLYCHTGCTIDDICLSLGIEQTDLFAPRDEKPINKVPVPPKLVKEQKRMKANINADGKVEITGSFSASNDEATSSIQIFGNDGEDGVGTNRAIKTNSIGELVPSLSNLESSLTYVGLVSSYILDTNNEYTSSSSQSNYPDILMSFKSTRNGLLFFDFSNDDTDWDTFPVNGFNIVGGVHEFHSAVKGSRFFRWRFRHTDDNDDDSGEECFDIDDDPTTPPECRYYYIDRDVMNAVEYTYTVVSYDTGIPTSSQIYSEGDEFNANPDEWADPVGYQNIESARGTTILDDNLIGVIPGPPSTGTDCDLVRVVPNPYFARSGLNETEYKRKIRFTRLSQKCTITIFTISGEKVRELEHDNYEDGNAWWDLRSYNNQEVAPGLYIYVVETPSGVKKIDKFAVVR